MVITKSPLTGFIACSNSGGFWGTELIRAGYAAIIVEGKAAKPTYVWIKDKEVELRDAGALWGKNSHDTTDELQKMVGDTSARVCCISQSGESLSKIAAVMNEKERAAGRSGVGAVMGSKNLKAVAICGSIGQAFTKENIGAYREVYDTLYNRVVNSKDMSKYHDIGTAVNVAPLSALKGLPTRNFSQGSFEGANLVSGELFAKEYLSQHTSCAHCQCGCIHLATLREEYKPWHYATSKVAYDYELIYALGTALSISSPQDILRLILEVERQGWDVISMGITLAWATEAYISGVITDRETGGLPLYFGNADGYLEMMRRCAAGEGEFFRDLELGCAKCSEKWGGKDFAIHYGGVEPAGYMTGENFVISSLLGVRHSHLDDSGYSIDQKILTKPQPVEEQVAQQVQEAQWRMILNSLAICLFARGV
jgi:aldehyde:ferredoxin oxidoreductase